MAAAPHAPTHLADLLRIPTLLRAVPPADAACLACASRALRDAVVADEHYWCAALGRDFGATEEGATLAPSPLAGAPPDAPPQPEWRRRRHRPAAPTHPASWRDAYGRWARSFPRGLPGPLLARSVRAWRRYERWLARQGATHVLASLRPGATAEALELAAEQLGLKQAAAADGSEAPAAAYSGGLPAGLAALYAVHDGQATPAGWMAALGAYIRDRGGPGARHPPPLRRRLDALARFEALSREELGLLPASSLEGGAGGGGGGPETAEQTQDKAATEDPTTTTTTTTTTWPPLHSLHLAAFPSASLLPPGFNEREFYREFVEHRADQAVAAERRRRQEAAAASSTATATAPPPPLPLSWEAAVLPRWVIHEPERAVMQFEGRAGALGGYRAYDHVPVVQLRPLHAVVPNALGAMAAAVESSSAAAGRLNSGGGLPRPPPAPPQQPLFLTFASASFAERSLVVCASAGDPGAGFALLPRPGDVFAVPANWRRLPPAHASAALLRAHPPRKGAEDEDGVLAWFEEFVARCERGEYAFATTPTGGFYDQEERRLENMYGSYTIGGGTGDPPLPRPYWPSRFDEDRGNMEDVHEGPPPPGAGPHRHGPAILSAGPIPVPPRSLADLGKFYGLRSDAPAPCGALSTVALPPSALAAVAATLGVRVRVSATLMPEACSSDQTSFCYCLRLCMPEDDPACYVWEEEGGGATGGGVAPPPAGAATNHRLRRRRRRVQLMSRQWRMLDAQGRLIDTASGPGVIGKHPVLWPGAGEFSYVSQTGTPGAAAVAAAAIAAGAGGGGGISGGPGTGLFAVPHPEGACCGYMEGTLRFVEMEPFLAEEQQEESETAGLPAAAPSPRPQPRTGEQFEVAVPRFALVVPRFVF